jgi:hypothetical protein
VELTNEPQADVLNKGVVVHFSDSQSSMLSRASLKESASFDKGPHLFRLLYAIVSFNGPIPFRFDIVIHSVVLLLVLIEARTLDGGPGQWPAPVNQRPEKKDLAGATKPLSDSTDPT